MPGPLSQSQLNGELKDISLFVIIIILSLLLQTLLIIIRSLLEIFIIDLTLD